MTVIAHIDLCNEATWWTLAPESGGHELVRLWSRWSNVGNQSANILSKMPRCANP